MICNPQTDLATCIGFLNIKLFLYQKLYSVKEEPVPARPAFISFGPAHSHHYYFKGQIVLKQAVMKASTFGSTRAVPRRWSYHRHPCRPQPISFFESSSESTLLISAHAFFNSSRVMYPLPSVSKPRNMVRMAASLMERWEGARINRILDNSYTSHDLPCSQDPTYIVNFKFVSLIMH